MLFRSIYFKNSAILNIKVYKTTILAKVFNTSVLLLTEVFLKYLKNTELPNGGLVMQLQSVCKHREEYTLPFFLSLRNTTINISKRNRCSELEVYIRPYTDILVPATRDPHVSRSPGPGNTNILRYDRSASM